MKAGTCRLCNHEQRAEIDGTHVAGASVRALAKRFGVSPTTIQKHVSQHIAAALIQRERRAATSIRQICLRCDVPLPQRRRAHCRDTYALDFTRN